MPKVVVYTTAIRPYCIRAKSLLKRKGVTIEEIPIEGNPSRIREMLERSQRRTAPQIFIDDFHVCGYDDLAELEALSKLAPLFEQSFSEPSDPVT